VYARLYTCQLDALMGSYLSASLVWETSARVVPSEGHSGDTPAACPCIRLGYLSLGALCARPLLLWALSYEPRVRCTCYGLSNVISSYEGWRSGGERKA
jgi:hypothetical protein